VIELTVSSWFAFGNRRVDADLISFAGLALMETAVPAGTITT